MLGAMKAIAKAKVKRNVVGIVAACENLISGSAYKPGDIIGSMSGKTIEILNTDAEGRLTLADALWYAATVVKADKIIDLATLTGACVVALGSANTGAVSLHPKGESSGDIDRWKNPKISRQRVLVLQFCREYAQAHGADGYE